MLLHKRIKVLFLLIILIGVLAACSQVNEQQEVESGDNTEDNINIAAYFPLNQGMEYYFAGEGNEYAPFSREIMYVEDNYLQLADDNGGTVVVAIYKINDQEISKVFSKGEFYEDDNLIPEVKGDEEAEVILQAPLEVGNSWGDNEHKREIKAVNQEVKVPAGIFYQVVRVKIKYEDSEATGYDYFAPNIGLIKREYVSEGFKIKSELESLSLNQN